MNKRDRAERARQEDAILNKVLLWIVGAVVLEALLLLLNKYYINYIAADIWIAAAISRVLPVLAGVFAVGCAACAVWTWKARAGQKGTGLPTALTIICAALAVCCAVARWVPNGTGIRFLYVAVPVAAVLAMIFYLYQREFFLAALISAAGLGGLWLLQRRGGHMAFVSACLIVLGVALVGCVVVAAVLQNAKGRLVLRGRPVQVLSPKANYVPIYVTCGLTAAVLIVGVLAGPAMLLYAVLAAWLLVLAVYYTVKLM